ncbi:MAG TPA: ribosomal protein S18-alanine N-acetyltransferase [Gammaproteobacteria bacterium]|jgi:ribosomal-protein-alanine acetyltransferase|nr:ribosomal protein S18-alanine N-acetyltransferase [Gammaproteobacteria bacterium]
MIRLATLRDIDALLPIEHRSFQTDRLTRLDFTRALKGKSAVLLVAEQGGAVLGYALIRVRGRQAHLESLAVDPDARRLGLGRTLLKAAEQAVLERGALHMRLEIREDNPAAYALYRALGYRQHGTWLEYYEDETDALRLRKALTIPGAEDEGLGIG